MMKTFYNTIYYLFDYDDMILKLIKTLNKKNYNHKLDILDKISYID